jgi:ribA/ribD-fused uncharacterized protein
MRGLSAEDRAALQARHGRDAIVHFSGKAHGWLSNFHRHPFIYAGQPFPTAEHAFQACKSRDEKERQRIADAKTPAAAKRLGRAAARGAHATPQWHSASVKDVKMYEVLAAKARKRAAGGRMWFAQRQRRRQP